MSETLDVLEKRWRGACRILFGAEACGLEECKEWLSGLTEPISHHRSSISSKEVISAPTDYCKSAKTFMLALAFMLMYAYLAEFIKLSAIVGAFIAGIVLNRSRHLKEIEDKTYGLEMLFMPIFFISLGMLVDVHALVEFAVPIVIITLIAFASKLIPCALASVLAGLRQKEAIAVGIGMAPRGEVALIVASLGLTTNVLTAGQYSIISAMALLTTFMVPPLLSRALKK
ncbi:TPA: cation:proton antiporter [Candidatus Micrarchaeota archaeon]|nr:cation:proton antiporter [Candidatus Micrarchaeota archaeon]HIH29946.1 cation:proton antiporter [Candidatus Micrarchaeota archaeon]